MLTFQNIAYNLCSKNNTHQEMVAKVYFLVEIWCCHLEIYMKYIKIIFINKVFIKIIYVNNNIGKLRLYISFLLLILKNTPLKVSVHRKYLLNMAINFNCGPQYLSLCLIFTFLIVALDSSLGQLEDNQTLSYSQVISILNAVAIQGARGPVQNK